MGEPATRHEVGAHTVDGVAHHPDVALHDRHELADRQQRGGLAGTVRAEQGHHLTLVDVEIEMADDRRAVVTGRQVVDLEQAGHDTPPAPEPR